MAVDLYVQDDNNIILDVPTNDLDLQLNQPVMVDPDYEHLQNLPQINHVTLIGDKSFAELGLVEATEESSGLMSAEDKAILDNIDETYVDWEHVDHALNSTSENPIDNKTVTHMFDRMGQDIAGKQDLLTFDNAPTEGSSNPVTSDGIFKATGNSAFYGCKVPSNTNPPQEVTILNGKTVTDIRRDVKAGKSVVLLVNYLSGGELKTLRFTATGGKDYPLDDPSMSEYYFYGNVTDYYIKLGTDNRLTWENTKVQTTSNLVVTLTPARTHSQYPSAKCVYDALVNKQSKLTFDDTPTQGSTNPVTSDGIYDAIMAKTDVVVYTGFCDYSVGSEVQPAGLNDGKTRADIIADIEANKIVIIRIEDLYMDVYDFVYAGKQNIFNEPPLSNEIAYTFIYNKATDNKCVKLLVASFSNSIQIQKWMDAEVVDNKVTSLSVSSTNSQYPSAKCVYDAIETAKGLIPTKTSDLNNDSGFVNATQAANAAPVQSVNGQTGTVTLDADDVGALPDTTSIPTKTSDLQNDGADGTSTYIETNELAAVATSGNYSDLNGTPTIPAAQVNADWNANSGVAEILNKPTIPAAGIPSGGNAGQILKKTSATDYDVNWADQTQYYPSGYSTTAADKQTKQIACSAWTATAKSYLHILLTHANTYAGKIYFTVNAVNTYEVWINGAVSSATNYSLPAGTYIIYFDGSAFQVRTDGIIPASVNGTAARIPYGECDSTSTSTAFTATVPGITELKDGVTMLLYNGVVTSASGFTININGLGAKPSYNNMTLGNSITPTSPTRDTTIFNINYAFLFVYSETLVSGGCWIGYRGYDANTNTIGYQLRTNNTTMKASDKFYRYRLLFTSADGTKWVPANTSTSTNATSARTPNTRAIDPFGEICWYGTTTAIEANANVTAGQLWQEYYSSYTNIGYSFNNTGSAATMTANLPIYIKCTPQADGSAIIDATTPYTQTLPSSDDGKIYIYLGRAYNATNFELLMNHPVYYHDGTGIRIWCGGRLMPNPPSTDGTYTLQCTVSNGVATYSWI